MLKILKKIRQNSEVASSGLIAVLFLSLFLSLSVTSKTFLKPLDGDAITAQQLKADIIAVELDQSVSVLIPLGQNYPVTEAVGPPCGSFNWRPLTDVADYPGFMLPSPQYEAQMASDPEFTNLIRTSPWFYGEHLSIPFDLLEPSQTYFYRVRVRDGDNINLVSAWSPRKSCTVPADFNSNFPPEEPVGCADDFDEFAQQFGYEPPSVFIPEPEPFISHLNQPIQALFASTDEQWLWGQEGQEEWGNYQQTYFDPFYPDPYLEDPHGFENPPLYPDADPYIEPEPEPEFEPEELTLQPWELPFDHPDFEFNSTHLNRWDLPFDHSDYEPYPDSREWHDFFDTPEDPFDYFYDFTDERSPHFHNDDLWKEDFYVMEEYFDETATFYQPMDFDDDFMTFDETKNIKCVQMTDIDAQLTFKPNENATLYMEFPEGVHVAGPKDWDGKIEPPLVRDKKLVKEAGEPIVGSDDRLLPTEIDTIVEAGAKGKALAFNKPATFVIPVDNVKNGETVKIYSSEDSEKWKSHSDETYTVKNGKVTITTKHLSYFAVVPTKKENQKAVANSGSSAGGSKDSEQQKSVEEPVNPFEYRFKFDDPQSPHYHNVIKNTTPLAVEKTIDKAQSVYQPVRLDESAFVLDNVRKIKKVSLTGSTGQLTLKPSAQASMVVRFPAAVEVEAPLGWDGKIQPPAPKEKTMIPQAGATIEGSDDKLEAAEIDSIIEVGAKGLGLSFSKPVAMEIPMDNVTNGKAVKVYFSEDGVTWAAHSDQAYTVVNGKISIETTHMSYFAVVPTEKENQVSSSSSSGGSGRSSWASYNYSDTNVATGGGSSNNSGGSSVKKKPRIPTLPNTLKPSSPGCHLNDINGHWAYDYIIGLCNADIVQGYSDHTFRPNSPINRVEITKIALLSWINWQTLPQSIANFGPNSPLTLGFKLTQMLNTFQPPQGALFPDTPADNWYHAYLHLAKLNNIVNGYSDGFFRPGNLATRAEVLKVLLNARGYASTVETLKDPRMPFVDIQASDWHVNYVKLAHSMGIVEGYPDNTFRPNQLVTRGELAKMTAKVFGLE